MHAVSPQRASWQSIKPVTARRRYDRFGLQLSGRRRARFLCHHMDLNEPPS
jgi:hypothetical protein